MMSVPRAPLNPRYDKLVVSYTEWKAFDEVIKKIKGFQLWDNLLKDQAEEIAKSLNSGGGQGFSIGTLKLVTTCVPQLNKNIAQEILAFRNHAARAMGISSKKKKNLQRVNMLIDEYEKIYSNTLGFLSEMERFFTLIRDSHSYISNEIGKYFKINSGSRRSRGSAYYKMIAELKKLRNCDNTFDHSAENLLNKAENLKKQHEEMLDKLKGELAKICKKEKRMKIWSNVVYVIFVGSTVGLAIASIVTAAIAAPAVAGAISASILPSTMVGHWITSWFSETNKSLKHQREVIEPRLKQTRVSIRELGDVKDLIEGVITKIDSLRYNPTRLATMDREQIDFKMKDIKSKLGAFLNKVEDLETAVKKSRREIMKARNDLHIMNTHVSTNIEDSVHNTRLGLILC